MKKKPENNDKEDFSETFSVFVLGKEKIDSMYEKMKVSKNEEHLQKILRMFKKTVYNMADKYKPPKPDNKRKKALINAMKAMGKKKKYKIFKPIV